MFKIKKYDISQKQVWDSFVCASKNGTFMLMRDYMDYHADRFVDFSLMIYDLDETLIALLPASLHKNELYSHGGLTYGGLICDKNMKCHKMLKIFDSLKIFLIENNIEKLLYKRIPVIYHKYPCDEDLYALFRNNAKLIRRDIASTILLSDPCKMPKGRRAQISRAKRENVQIKESMDFDRFILLENEILLARHNTRAVHTAKELKMLKSKFNKNIELWVAEYNSQIIAGALLFIYDNVVHTQYLAANDKAREIGALDLLIKTLIDKYTEEHKTYFDFGISTENNGQYLNEGLIGQKESFGGRGIVYDFYELKIID